MNWVTDFIIPVIKIVVIGSIFIGVFGFIFYTAYKFWKNFLRLFIKYDIFRNKYDPVIMEYCVKSWQDGITNLEMRKGLLLAGNTMDEMKETLYIYGKIQNQLGKKEVKERYGSIRRVKEGVGQAKGTTKSGI